MAESMIDACLRSEGSDYDKAKCLHGHMKTSGNDGDYRELLKLYEAIIGVVLRKPLASPSRESISTESTIETDTSAGTENRPASGPAAETPSKPVSALSARDPAAIASSSEHGESRDDVLAAPPEPSAHLPPPPPYPVGTAKEPSEVVTSNHPSPSVDEASTLLPPPPIGVLSRHAPPPAPVAAPKTSVEFSPVAPPPPPSSKASDELPPIPIPPPYAPKELLQGSSTALEQKPTDTTGASERTYEKFPPIKPNTKDRRTQGSQRDAEVNAQNGDLPLSITVLPNQQIATTPTNGTSNLNAHNSQHGYPASTSPLDPLTSQRGSKTTKARSPSQSSLGRGELAKSPLTAKEKGTMGSINFDDLLAPEYKPQQPTSAPQNLALQRGEASVAHAQANLLATNQGSTPAAPTQGQFTTGDSSLSAESQPEQNDILPDVPSNLRGLPRGVWGAPEDVPQPQPAPPAAPTQPAAPSAESSQESASKGRWADPVVRSP